MGQKLGGHNGSRTEAQRWGMGEGEAACQDQSSQPAQDPICLLGLCWVSSLYLSMECLPSKPRSQGLSERDVGIILVERSSQTLMGVLCSNPHRPPHLIIMNWCMIISGLIVVVLKVVGMTLFLLHCEYLSNLLPQLHVDLFLDSFLRRRG